MSFSKRTDVVVIGGGAMGSSIAYHCAVEGKRVTLVEWRNLASGASGRCGGMYMQLFGRDLNIDKTKERLMLTKMNSEMIPILQEKLGDFEFRVRGSLDVALTDDEFRDMAEIYTVQRSLGDEEIQLLDKNETKKQMPTLTDHIAGSRYRPSDGNLSPFKMVMAFANGAKKKGALVLTNTKVRKILEKNGRISGVETSRGIIESEWVVNATNAWASFLTKEVEVIPVRELAMVTERVPPLKTCTFEARCAEDFAYGCTQTKSGNLLLGGPGLPTIKGNTYDYYDETIYLHEVQKCAVYIKNLLPTLQHINVIRSWAGTMAFTPDGIPHIGLVPGKEGLVIAAGFAAGMSEAAAVGKLISELVAHGKFSVNMEAFDPGRPSAKPIEWPHPYKHEDLHEFLAVKLGSLQLAKERSQRNV